MIMSNFLFDDYLIVNIVSRLPVESVLRCRCVCKSWRALLHELYFIQIHTDRIQQQQQQQQHIDDQCPLSLFVLEVNGNINNFECFLRDYYVKYDDERVPSSSHKVISSLLHPSPCTTLSKIIWLVIGSSNGLICLYGFNTVYNSWRRRLPRPALIIIYNPITREYLNLPVGGGGGDGDVDDIDIDIKDRRYNVAIGFGYHPSTKEYKIVRIIYQSDDFISDSYDRWLHIYTLGSSGRWRIKKAGLPPVTYQGNNYYTHADGAHVNGAIYWLTRSYDKIVSFDLEDEKFRIIDSLPSPHCHNLLGGERLIVRGVFFCVGEGETQDIWVMNNNGDQYSWSKEFSIIPVKGLSPLSSRFVAFGRDRVVCLYHRKNSLISFDSKTKTFQSLDDFGDKYCFGITSYTKSLVSLKALGEEDAKVVIETQQPAATATADMMIKLLGFAMVTIQLLQL